MALSAYALAPIASQMRMPAEALVALPTVVDVFAKNAGMTECRMVVELLENSALRDYAEEICIKTYREALA